MKKTFFFLLLTTLCSFTLLSQKPVVFYLNNLPFPRIGTESDDGIIRELKADGFLVLEVDCSVFPKTSPELEDALVKFHLESPEYIKLFTTEGEVIDYGTVLYVPAGYKVARNIPIWNIEKYGPPNIKDRVLKSYNTDVVKKHKISPAKTADDMVTPDGKPLDYNMYIDFIYPSGNPHTKVPLLLNFSSNDPRFFPFSPKGEKQVAYRAIFPIGFLISGYALANMDHCFIPTAKRSTYGHSPVYSLDRYTAVAYVTSGIRYIRSVADKYNLNGKIGTMGISKASYSAVISANVHNNTMKEFLDEYGAPNPNQPYQGYSSKVDVAYAASGEGTWRIPEIIDSESVPMVTSMGKFDKFTRHWTHYPVLLSHLNKVDNIHLDLWMEELGHTYPGMGDDFATGMRRYSLIKTFYDRYLKPEEHVKPEVFYILPKLGTKDVKTDGTFRTMIPDDILPPDMKEISKYDPVTVRFLSPMNIALIKNYLQVVNKKDGKTVKGIWNAYMKNTCFRFTPDGKLEKGSTYVIKILKGAPDIAGNTLEKSASREFEVSM